MTQGQQNFMYGKVNNVTSEKGKKAQDVVLGMFLASSHSATILFDIRASHSFISSSFVARHNLLIATMKHTMLFSSPRGEMRTKHVCPTVSISVRVDFLSNLIILESKHVDICHTRFCYQNYVLIVCMTQDQLFHTYGQKWSQITKCHE
jgi:hypothetical protein